MSLAYNGFQIIEQHLEVDVIR